MLKKDIEYWRGKTVLITGGSSGIGLALAHEVVETCGAVAIISRNDTSLSKAKKILTGPKNQAKIRFYPCDVGSSVQVKKMANRVLKEVGCPDIIINNAGFAHFYTFDQMDENDIEETANVNFSGFLRVTRAFLPAMITATAPGCIVNIASVAGAFPITPNAVYGAAKAGMLAFSELLGIELDHFGIRVVTVCPGRVETSFFDHISYKRRVAGSETQIVTPIRKVTDGIIRAVTAQKRVVFIPGYWRYFAWLLSVDKLVLRPLYRAFLKKRVARLRNQK